MSSMTAGGRRGSDLAREGVTTCSGCPGRGHSTVHTRPGEGTAGAGTPWRGTEGNSTCRVIQPRPPRNYRRVRRHSGTGTTDMLTRAVLGSVIPVRSCA